MCSEINQKRFVVHLAVSVAIVLLVLIKVWSSETSDVRSFSPSTKSHVRSSVDCHTNTKASGIPDPFVSPSNGGMKSERDTMNDTIQRPESFLYIFLPSVQVQVLCSLIKINTKHEKWATLLLYSTFLIYVGARNSYQSKRFGRLTYRFTFFYC